MFNKISAARVALNSANGILAQALEEEKNKHDALCLKERYQNDTNHCRIMYRKYRKSCFWILDSDCSEGGLFFYTCMSVVINYLASVGIKTLTKT